MVFKRNKMVVVFDEINIDYHIIKFRNTQKNHCLNLYNYFPFSQARPEQMTSMSTEEPKTTEDSVAVTTHMIDDQSESNESMGGEADDDSEFI